MTPAGPEDGIPAADVAAMTQAPSKARRSPRLTVVTDSELQTWRSCHLKHHFQYRERLRPKVEAKALAVGSIFHAGMRGGLLAGWAQGWQSRPQSQRLADEIAAAIAGIDERVMEWASNTIAHATAAIDFAALEEEVNQTAAMVKWMLEHYFKATASDLDNFVLVCVEEKFEVMMRDKRGRYVKHLRHSGVKDLVFYDGAYNQIVLGEHKTSGGNPRDIEKRVEMDTQTGGYINALREARATGKLVAVDGTDLSKAFLGRVMYNVLRKALPRSPSVNKDGTVSVAGCTTTVELYQAALDAQVKERGKPVTEKQAAFVERLRAQGDSFFARVEYHRTPEEMERWRSDTVVDAARIRSADRNPEERTRNTGHCNMPWSLPCPYRTICLDDTPETRALYRVAGDPHEEVRDAEVELAEVTGGADPGTAQ